MPEPSVTEVLEINQRLLDSIDLQDWSIYTKLCDPSLTAFEPEAVGHLVAGMDFHKFYFDMERSGRPKRSTMSSPQVRWLGNDVAIVTYIRVVQRIEADGRPASAAFEETRVWQLQDGIWQHVHFHRSG